MLTGGQPAHPRRHAVRAALLLFLNLLLFSGLCIFIHWLHVARAFDFSWRSYIEPLKFWGEQAQTLNDFVIYPISVEQNLMHGVVLGLLVASIVAVPISVAILYRFAYALPFIAAVLVFAHMPWMALTLVGSCILAAVKPFRLSFRFGAALVGMLPVIVYLYLAMQGAPQQLGTYSSPDQKLLLSAPWLLAILAACAMLGIIMAFSRIANYRRGAVAPVMAIMFATPAILFARYVGFDEVSYRVLESVYGPRAPMFATRDVSGDIFSLIEERLESADRERMLSWFLSDANKRADLLHRLVGVCSAPSWRTAVRPRKPAAGSSPITPAAGTCPAPCTSGRTHSTRDWTCGSCSRRILRWSASRTPTSRTSSQRKSGRRCSPIIPSRICRRRRACAWHNCDCGAVTWRPRPTC